MRFFVMAAVLYAQLCFASSAHAAGEKDMKEAYMMRSLIAFVLHNKQRAVEENAKASYASIDVLPFFQRALYRAIEGDYPRMQAALKMADVLKDRTSDGGMYDIIANTATALIADARGDRAWVYGMLASPKGRSGGYNWTPILFLALAPIRDAYHGNVESALKFEPQWERIEEEFREERGMPIRVSPILRCLTLFIGREYDRAREEAEVLATISGDSIARDVGAAILALYYGKDGNEEKVIEVSEKYGYSKRSNVLLAAVAAEIAYHDRNVARRLYERASKMESRYSYRGVADDTLITIGLTFTEP
jgi:hypothetical protein